MPPARAVIGDEAVQQPRSSGGLMGFDQGATDQGDQAATQDVERGSMGSGLHLSLSDDLIGLERLAVLPLRSLHHRPRRLLFLHLLRYFSKPASESVPTSSYPYFLRPKCPITFARGRTMTIDWMFLSGCPS